MPSSTAANTTIQEPSLRLVSLACLTVADVIASSQVNRRTITIQPAGPGRNVVTLGRVNSEVPR